MFIGMIYGDQFSTVSLFEGRWLEPIGRLIYSAWDRVAEALDLILAFVERHSAWVLATASGTAGLSIVAFLMFSGMAEDASATHRDLTAPIMAGSVIDNVPEIAVTTSPGAILLASLKVDDSNIVQQRPGAPYLVFNRPEYDAPLVMRSRQRRSQIAFPAPEVEPLQSLDRPAMDITFQRIEVRSQRFEDNTVSSTRGQLIDLDQRMLSRVISDALRGLRRDDWQLTHRDPPRRSGFGDAGLIPDRITTLPEATNAELRDLESRANVRIVPGDNVAESDLRIEKTFPLESVGQELTIEINVLNVGNDTVSGLLIREFLPRNTRVKAAEPNAAFRDDTLTWLLDNLRPFEQQILRFTVLPNPSVLQVGNSRRPQFESLTEASAITAVTSRTIARRNETLRRPIPEIVRRPELQMRIEEPLTPVQVCDDIEVVFVVRNVGSAAAEGVGLRVVLDQGLSHHRLEKNSSNREVVNGVKRLEPNEIRRITLRMRAVRTGEFVSQAEMVFEGSPLTRNSFRVVAENTNDPLPADPVIR